MNQPFKFGSEAAADRIVYVRSVEVVDLPQEVRDQVGDMTTLYSVNRPDGERLALVKDRDLAFDIARQNDLAPVSVH